MSKIKNYSLTEAEKAVLVLSSEGLEVEEIRKKLFIEIATIKAHLSKCYLKLELETGKGKVLKFKAIREATKRGWINLKWIKEILPEGYEVVKIGV